MIESSRPSASRPAPLRLAVRVLLCLAASASAFADRESVLPAAFEDAGDASRPAYGLLWLQIDPDSVSIALDGEFLDRDVWLISVAPGSHLVRLSKPGYQPRESRFEIGPGQNVRLDLSLSPALD